MADISTDLAFNLATGKPSAKYHTPTEQADALDVMYPGIAYTGGDIFTLSRKMAGPDLKQLYPKLAEFKTAAEAITALGETLPLPELRPVRDYDWLLTL